ncbi:MAG: protein phosphatase CheZ [Afipia sp.]|nr:protein phosphatase CheZ [Afipia sp.]
MAIQRKRYRIETMQSGELPVIVQEDGSVSAQHHQVMSELRAIRTQMASPQPLHAGDDAPSPDDLAAAQKLLGSYRAQIEQCEKLKVELDLIHDAIARTKQEIAVLHGKSFSGDEMAKVTGELGAVVGGTEEATQQILEAAEAIDQAATALGKTTSPDQHTRLSEEIQDRVVGIFEACNFQDLTGQRISKVMTTMKFIEHHINVMMDIWGGVDAIKQHAPPIVDTRVGDARLLNGPKGPDEAGHVSQDDIDALFD